MISYDNVYTIRKLKELELSIDVLISKKNGSNMAFFVS